MILTIQEHSNPEYTGVHRLDQGYNEEVETPEDILQQHLAGIEYHIEQGMFSRQDLETP
jgi:hypothetical protein